MKYSLVVFTGLNSTSLAPSPRERISSDASPQPCPRIRCESKPSEGKPVVLDSRLRTAKENAFAAKESPYYKSPRRLFPCISPSRLGRSTHKTLSNSQERSSSIDKHRPFFAPGCGTGFVSSLRQSEPPSETAFAHIHLPPSGAKGSLHTGKEGVSGGVPAPGSTKLCLPTIPTQDASDEDESLLGNCKSRRAVEALSIKQEESLLSSKGTGVGLPHPGVR